jgi:hypothetical protein
MGDVIDLGERRKRAEREREVTVFDPLGQGEREVLVVDVEPPAGWHKEPGEGGHPRYVHDGYDVVVNFLASVDDSGRSWHHVFLGVPWPIDEAMVLEVASDFFPGKHCLMETPWRTKPHRGIVGIHHCVTDPQADLPQRKS